MPKRGLDLWAGSSGTDSEAKLETWRHECRDATITAGGLMEPRGADRETRREGGLQEKTKGGSPSRGRVRQGV